jgi:hypothetical protein
MNQIPEQHHQERCSPQRMEYKQLDYRLVDPGLINAILHDRVNYNGNAAEKKLSKSVEQSAAISSTDIFERLPEMSFHCSLLRS